MASPALFFRSINVSLVGARLCFPQTRICAVFLNIFVVNFGCNAVVHTVFHLIKFNTLHKDARHGEIVHYCMMLIQVCESKKGKKNISSALSKLLHSFEKNTRGNSLCTQILLYIFFGHTKSPAISSR